MHVKCQACARAFGTGLHSKVDTVAIAQASDNGQPQAESDTGFAFGVGLEKLIHRASLRGPRVDDAQAAVMDVDEYVSMLGVGEGIADKIAQQDMQDRGCNPHLSRRVHRYHHIHRLAFEL